MGLFEAARSWSKSRKEENEEFLSRKNGILFLCVFLTGIERYYQYFPKAFASS